MRFRLVGTIKIEDWFAMEGDLPSPLGGVGVWQLRVVVVGGGMVYCVS